MKNFSTLIACQIAALVASVSGAAQDAPEGSFAPGAWKLPSEGDPLYFFGTRINANGGKFYINREVSTYCPEGVTGLDCSGFTGMGTTVVVGDSTIGLIVTVPAYIAPDGSLSFTKPHSAYIPPGSTITGFSLRTSEEPGNPTYLEIENKSFYLCPVSEDESINATFQVFAFSANPDNCVSTEIRTYAPDQGDVWEYI